LGARGYADEYATGLNSSSKFDITAFAGGGNRYYRNDFYLILATKFKLPNYGIRQWMK